MRNYNIKEKYSEKEDPWSDILEMADFVIISTENRLKGYSPGQLLFGSDMIIPIKHTSDLELIRQRNQPKIIK